MEKTDIKDRDSALKYTLEELEKFEKKYDTRVKITEVEEGYSVSIPMEFFDESCELQHELYHMGIDFDTGAGFGFRDWELDWSFRYKGLDK